jgi:hypothetical protein
MTLLFVLWMSFLTQPTPKIPAAEYEVYAQLIQARYDSKLFVIQRQSDVAGEMEQEVLPELAPGCAADFLAKNKQPHTWERAFPLQAKYVLVRSADWDDKDWDTFAKQFPGADGVLSLSRVGFNADQTEAIVSVFMLYQPLSGSGVTLLMHKEGTRWKVKKTLWVTQT